MAEIQPTRPTGIVNTEQEALLNKAVWFVSDVLDKQRVFLDDPAALKVLTAEQEQAISYNDLAKLPAYAGYLKQLNDGTLHPDDKRPDMTPDAVTGRLPRFNSNNIAKISTALVVPVTAANMIAGTRVGPNGQMQEGLEPELAVAAMLYDTIGRTTRGGGGHVPAGLLESKRIAIDEAYIEKEFGPKVAQHVTNIRAALAALDDPNKDPAFINSEYASVTAAISAARVREAAKVVSLGLIDRLHPDALQAFLIENKLEGEANPAGTLLDREYAKLQKVLENKGIAAAVRKPIDEVLVPAIEAYNGSKKELGDAHALWGNPNPKEGDPRGTAYARFNLALPINNYKTDASPITNLNDLDTYKMLHVLNRYHQDSQRKGGVSIFAHVMSVGGQAAATLGRRVRAAVMEAGLGHDLLEDGGKEVANKDVGPNLVKEAFGEEVWKLLAEMTDGVSKDHYMLRAVLAARDKKTVHLFAEDTTLSEVAARIVQDYRAATAGLTGDDKPALADKSDDVLEAEAKEILKKMAFSLTTAGPKLADVYVTARENLLHPELCKGGWECTGRRVGWIVNTKSKGYVANELYDSVLSDVDAFFASRDPEKHDVPLGKTGHLEGTLNHGLLNVLSLTKTGFDQYTVQNLAILADEFGLSPDKWKEMTAKFLDLKGTTNKELTQYLDATLKEENFTLKGNLSQSTLYAPGDPPTRSYTNLLLLRDQLELRETGRKRILSTVSAAVNERYREDIFATMAPNWKIRDGELLLSEPLMDTILHYDLQMSRQPRFKPDPKVQTGRDAQVVQSKGALGVVSV